MFVRYFVELDHSSSAIEDALLTAPGSMIPAIASLSDNQGQHLLAEVGFPIEGHRVSKKVEIEVGKPLRTPARTWIPMSWRATGPSGIFPVLEGDLEVAPLGPQRTQLSLSAQYRPPLGFIGRTVDRALLSRVAEATVKNFVERVGNELEQRLKSARTA